MASAHGAQLIPQAPCPAPASLQRLSIPAPRPQPPVEVTSTSGAPLKEMERVAVEPLPQLDEFLPPLSTLSGCALPVRGCDDRCDREQVLLNRSGVVARGFDADSRLSLPKHTTRPGPKTSNDPEQGGGMAAGDQVAKVGDRHPHARWPTGKTRKGRPVRRVLVPEAP